MDAFGFVDSHETHRLARRARIRRQFKERDGIEWNATENKYLDKELFTLRCLAHERKRISVQDFSDDEVEEEEDSDDEAESEEQWEYEQEDGETESEEEWEDEEDGEEDDADEEDRG